MVVTDIDAWLSGVPVGAEPGFTGETSLLHSKRKRKLHDDGINQSRKCTDLHRLGIGMVLTESSLNAMDLPGATSPKVPITPTKTDKSKCSSKASSNASDPKQTINVNNCRAELAEHGLFFDNIQSFERQEKLKAIVDQIVNADRDSAMSKASLQATKKWKQENATKPEKVYYDGAFPLYVNEVRNVDTNKRDAEGHIIREAKSFSEDGMDKQKDCLFVKKIMPVQGERDDSSNLTTPKPDWVFGFRVPQYPPKNLPKLSGNTKALIRVAPGLEHAFFAVEHKGAGDSIEAAENQAIRTGATLVAARRRLNEKAYGKTGAIIRTKESISVSSEGSQNNDPCNAAPRQSVIVNPGFTNLEKTGQLLSTAIDAHDFGADVESLAFSCTWVPHMAQIHVHWCEACDDGSEYYHMNHVKSYLLNREDDIREFGRDVHNIMDWGISKKRKNELEAMCRAIEGRERQS